MANDDSNDRNKLPLETQKPGGLLIAAGVLMLLTPVIFLAVMFFPSAASFWSAGNSSNSVWMFPHSTKYMMVESFIEDVDYKETGGTIVREEHDAGWDEYESDYRDTVTFEVEITGDATRVYEKLSTEVEYKMTLDWPGECQRQETSIVCEYADEVTAEVYIENKRTVVLEFNDYWARIPAQTEEP